MRLSTILVLLFFLTPLCIYAQLFNENYATVCTYEFAYQTDSTDTKSRKKEDMLLLLSETGSLFKSKNKFLLDSAQTSNEALNSMGSMAFAMNTKTNYYFSIFKNRSDKITTIDFVRNDAYLYTEPKQSFNWTVTSDTSTVAGLSCFKAVTKFSGRLWIAWFAPDIPIPDGPYKFNGLPGLIVSISDSTGSYSFTLTELVNRPTFAWFPKSMQTVKVSKSKYFAQLKYYIENRYELDQLKGVTFTSGQEQFKKRFEELAKKNNNPIEIKID